MDPNVANTMAVIQANEALRRALVFWQSGFQSGKETASRAHAVETWRMCQELETATKEISSVKAEIRNVQNRHTRMALSLQQTQEAAVVLLGTILSERAKAEEAQKKLDDEISAMRARAALSNNDHAETE